MDNELLNETTVEESIFNDAHQSLEDTLQKKMEDLTAGAPAQTRKGNSFEDAIGSSIDTFTEVRSAIIDCITKMESTDDGNPDVVEALIRNMHEAINVINENMKDILLVKHLNL